MPTNNTKIVKFMDMEARTIRTLNFEQSGQTIQVAGLFRFLRHRPKDQYTGHDGLLAR
ncbi:hypothetical protein [Parabacteroides sp.]